MKIIKVKDYEEMSEQAADMIAAEIQKKADSLIGFATGSTPAAAYEKLVSRYRAGQIDFSGIRTVNLDEYKGLSAEDPQSYAWYMHHRLFDHINILPKNIHLLDGLSSDDSTQCSEYDNYISSCGGIDLQILGLGMDCHIGFNEPAPYFTLETHPVDLDQSTIQANKRFFASENQVPRQAYTMGIRSIFESKTILILVNGENKADAVKKAFQGKVTSEVPASILQLHPNTILIADEAALSKMTERQNLC